MTAISFEEAPLTTISRTETWPVNLAGNQMPQATKVGPHGAQHLLERVVVESDMSALKAAVSTEKAKKLAQLSRTVGVLRRVAVHEAVEKASLKEANKVIQDDRLWVITPDMHKQGGDAVRVVGVYEDPASGIPQLEVEGTEGPGLLPEGVTIELYRESQDSEIADALAARAYKSHGNVRA